MQALNKKPVFATKESYKLELHTCFEMSQRKKLWKVSSFLNELKEMLAKLDEI